MGVHQHLYVLKRRGGGWGRGTVGRVGVWHSRKGRGMALLVSVLVLIVWCW